MQILSIFPSQNMFFSNWPKYSTAHSYLFFGVQQLSGAIELLSSSNTTAEHRRKAQKHSPPLEMFQPQHQRSLHTFTQLLTESLSKKEPATK